MSASHFLKLPRLMTKMLKSEKKSKKSIKIVYKNYLTLHTGIGALIPAVVWYQA